MPGYNQLSEAEVMERYVAIEARKKRILEKRLRAEQREERRRQTEELSLKMAEARLQKKFEQQGMQTLFILNERNGRSCSLHSCLATNSVK